MPNFWCFTGNEKYNIGCTGQTVYLYDKSGTEIAKFKDLPYAYTAAISPKGDIFVVKTTEGRLAVYSLNPPALIKKFRFSKVDASQDDNFCFSPDGTEFFNIERHIDSCKTALSIYDTKDFSLKNRILSNDLSIVLSSIEYCSATNEIYLLGFYRDDNGIAYKYYVGKPEEDDLQNVVIISKDEFDFYVSYIDLKMKGFSKKAYEWSYLDIDIEKLRNSDHSLSELWNYYRKLSAGTFSVNSCTSFCSCPREYFIFY